MLTGRSEMKGKWLVAALLLLLMAMLAVAAENSGDGKWEFGAEVYLWGAGIDVSTTVGGDIDISFSDLIDNLDMALMTTLAAGKDKWALFADVIYMDVSDDQKGTAHILGQPIKTKTDVELEAWIVTMAGAYAVIRWG